MKLFKERILPAALFIVALASFMIPVAIWGKHYLAGRITSFIFTTLMCSIFAYEYFNANRMKKVYSIILAIFTSISIFTPIQNVNKLLINIENQKLFTTDEFQFFMTILLRESILNWLSIVILLIVSLAFSIIELTNKTNMSSKDRIYRFFLTFMTLWFLTNACRFIQISLIFRWELALFICAAPSISDIGGFIGGKFLGKKLINKSFSPNISPKKTWEGFMFAIVFGWAFSISMILGLNLINSNLFAQIPAIILIPFAAVGGDLFFSYLKRINGIKDYSKILVGHGGLLDRFDSITFATMILCITYAFL